MDVKQTLTYMIELLNSVLEDADKFERGQDAAGRRIRVALSKTAASCKTLRSDIQAVRNQRKTDK